MVNKENLPLPREISIKPSSNSTRVQEMPDFRAALDDYKRILKENGVHPIDIDKVTGNIVESNKTRSKGNYFINFVNDITRT